MQKPLHTLFFIGIIFFVLGIISLIFPENGIKINDQLVVNYPTFSSIFKKSEESKPDISNIIALADEEEKELEKPIDERKEEKKNDTNVHIKKITIKDSIVKLNTNIQYKNESKSALANFFKALANINSEPKSIRVLHYGDSQIEGDRISDYLRLKLQSQFGGEGPGFVSFMPVAASVINKISWSSNWDRYCTFAGRDKRVPHNNFGLLAHVTRFSPYSKINVNDTSSYKSAWVKIVTSKNGGKTAVAFKKIRLFYGGAQTKTHVELYENGSLNNSDSLLAGGYFNIKEFNLNQGALIHEFKFKGKDSPDFYGASLESQTGVLVDNIGLRGSSGTFFSQINFAQLKQFYDYLNTKLIILQFGGNALPGIKTKEVADDYARYFKNQIALVKKLAPQASILVIGPADMSVKVGTEYMTHPQLENLRDALKKAAFDSDCAFFDMYHCMGGKNSMLTWVEQGIGAKDYIHFSSGGARKIAVLLYSSLMNDYINYTQQSL